MKQEDAFARALGALRPWLGHLVIAGGWAHRLFLLHPLAKSPTFEPLLTEDADVVAPERPPALPEMSELLLVAGFEPRFSGEERPPISEYVLEGAEGFSIEFISPLVGAAVDRNGKSRATVRVGGVTAQRLRHVELLKLSPWDLRLTRGKGFAVPAPGLRVRVAHPAAYLAQKLLVLQERRDRRAEKDVLYLHDTLHIFTDALDALAEDWRKVSSSIPSATGARLGELARNRFSAVDAVARGAARIAEATGRAAPPSPESITQACRLGLRRLFPPGARGAR